MSETYDARQIANWFVERARKDDKHLSVMSLLKLAYIAHGWYLEINDKPLFGNEIQAWKLGPVIPDVYNAFRKQGAYVFTTVPVKADWKDINEADGDFLGEVYDVYKKYDPFELSELTHVQGGPWEIASEIGGPYAPIPDYLIRQHYVSKRMRAENQMVRE